MTESNAESVAREIEKYQSNPYKMSFNEMKKLLDCCLSERESALTKTRADALEEAAGIAERDFLIPIKDWYQTKKEFSAVFGRMIAEAIRQRSRDDRG